MIFFNYERIYVLAKANPDLIVSYFTDLVRDINMNEALIGPSYILNEKVVTNNPHRLSKQQLAEYLGVLSFRNYADYKFTGDTSLDMFLFPAWVPKDVVLNNPLIAIKSNRLIFIEEIKHG
ncbi:hypothetical protein CPT_Slocum_159 [Serratia phage Slocum]|nr:hypothetical protein CPT_Slocum_159 [Serratia phage Slocum]URC22551.1 hypothetical protein KAMAJI_01230 [Serratia phage vB_SmaM-Kamaji]